MNNSLDIDTLVNGSLEENCYFLRLPGRGEGILVDPGAEFEKLDAAVQKSGARPVLVIATHGHFDHVGQVEAFREKYGLNFAMHPDDLGLLDVLEDNYAFYGLGKTKKPGLDIRLEDGRVVEAAGIKLKVLHTPGHSPGGVCLYHEESAALFSGDTLFRRSVGRADFPGSSPEALEKSIREKLYTLPDHVKVYPGHGEATLLGEEKSQNPFVRI